MLTRKVLRLQISGLWAATNSDSSQCECECDESQQTASKPRPRDDRMPEATHLSAVARAESRDGNCTADRRLPFTLQTLLSVAHCNSVKQVGE